MLVMAAILGACGKKQETPQAANDSSPTTQSKPVKLDIGLLNLTRSAPLLIAMEKGFFKDEGEGIEANAKWFEAAQSSIGSNLMNMLSEFGI